MSTLPESLNDLFNLALTREILLRDRDTHLPEGARAQRADLLQQWETLIADEAQAATIAWPPVKPTFDNPLEQRAWEFLETQRSATPRAPVADSYKNLQHTFHTLSALYAADEVLSWLHQTRALPDIPDDQFMRAMGSHAVLRTVLLQRPAIKEWLTDAKTKNHDAIDSRNLALMEHLWRTEAGLDPQLANDWKRASLEGERIWSDARSNSDFEQWRPSLEKVLDLTRKKGEAFGKALGTTPYQGLLDYYNPGLRNETVTPLFAQLEEKLPELIIRIQHKQKQDPPALPLPPLPPAQQEAILRRVLKAMGFDHTNMLLGGSSHPFSTGEYDDVRLTIRKDSVNFMDDLMATVHEAGHGVYSRQLPRAHKGQPYGAFQSMWVHETQSLFWEKQIGHSPEFMEFLARVIHEETGTTAPEWSAANLSKLVNKVERSFIRTEADEVTYPMHVILRHRLEQKLLDGSLKPENLPDAWNRRMEAMLGVQVPNDAQGCMQDTHWPEGMYGYFPAYTFGALGAAQLMDTLRTDMPDVSDRIRAGDFTAINQWLEEKIHRHGSALEGEALFTQATGKPLTADAWLGHIERRYLNTPWQNRANQPRNDTGRSA